MLYPAAKGGLHLFDAASGRLVMTWKPERTQSPLAPSSARVVVSQAGDWYLTDQAGVVRKLRPSYTSAEVTTH